MIAIQRRALVEKFNKKRLSNQAIAALSRYVHKVRNSLGVVKVSDIVNDHRYAFDLFIQTVLSEEDGMASLTRQANREMDIEKPLINALDTYFTQIKLRAKNNEVIHKYKYF